MGMRIVGFGPAREQGWAIGTLPPAPARRSIGSTTFLVLTGLWLSACSGGSTPDPELGVAASPRVVGAARAVPKGGGVYKVGDPYKVGGRWYVPREDKDYDRTGVASWYGAAFHGRRTANGEIYDMNALTAGHPTMPLPSYAYVTNVGNGRTILVRINDRGPYVNDRLIDLSSRSARELGFTNRGLARVRVRYAGRAPLNGNDRAERQYLASQRWSRDDFNVAQGPSAITTASVTRGYDPPPAWSVTGYRESVAASGRPSLASRPTGLGGPAPSYVEAGIFSTRADAERMRHELEGLGPVEVAAMPGSTVSEPSFRVRLGPFASSAAADVARKVADRGIAANVTAQQ